MNVTSKKTTIKSSSGYKQDPKRIKKVTARKTTTTNGGTTTTTTNGGVTTTTTTQVVREGQWVSPAKGRASTAKKTTKRVSAAQAQPVRSSPVRQSSPARTQIRGDVRARIEANMKSNQLGTSGNIFHN